MKQLQFLVLAAAVTLVSGCVVQSSYSKTIAVTKDAQGKVIQTVESETVVQGAHGYPLRLDLIKGVQTN